MTSDIQGVGWYLRRTRDQERLGAFYRDVVGLPQVRQHDKTPVFWLGETVVMGINYGEAENPVFQDRTESPMTPVFRVADLDDVVARLHGHGVRFLNEPFTIPNGKVAYFLDPDGNVTGIQQRDRTSHHNEDIEAWRRWDTGETALEGAPSMPPNWQNLGWVVLRSVDVPNQIEFLRDVVGLSVRSASASYATFSVGDVCLLEVSLGNGAMPAPADRSNVTNAVVLRVNDVDRTAERLRERGVRFINEPFDIGGGRVGYFADPEGHVLGIQTRWDSSQRVEDIEARRRIAAGRRPT